MKNLGMVLFAVLLFSACCDDCKEVDEDFLIERILAGDVVKVEDTQEVVIRDELIGIIDVSVVKSAVITCNLFGVPQICSQTGTKGRCLGKNDAEPTDGSFQIYEEADSDAHPGDLTGMLLYSNVIYPYDFDTSANVNALRGGVAAFGPGWNNARVDFCDIGNPKGTHIHCVQE
jgi:hypothetical protein